MLARVKCGLPLGSDKSSLPVSQSVSQAINTAGSCTYHQIRDLTSCHSVFIVPGQALLRVMYQVGAFSQGDSAPSSALCDANFLGEASPPEATALTKICTSNSANKHSTYKRIHKVGKQLPFSKAFMHSYYDEYRVAPIIPSIYSIHGDFTCPSQTDFLIQLLFIHFGTCLSLKKLC
jgi:hypothetical protein